jgi:hypothetical protein
MRKKIKFISINQYIYDTENISTPAYKLIPEWYRKINANYEDSDRIGRDKGTVKKMYSLFRRIKF